MNIQFVIGNTNTLGNFLHRASKKTDCVSESTDAAYGAVIDCCLINLKFGNMFSKSCQYGLQAMIYLALKGNGDARVGLQEIADHQKIPQHFLSKILQLLVKCGYLGSTKGKHGGFYLLKSPERINLLEIAITIDGNEFWDECGLGLKMCSDRKPCPIHHDFKKVKLEMKESLKERSLWEVCEEIRDKKTMLVLK